MCVFVSYINDKGLISRIWKELVAQQQKDRQV